MRCSSCGERLAATDERCPLCGAAVARALTESSPVVQRCPRCHYAGQGIGYFRRPGHLGLLAAVSVFTWGVGGIVYWLLRRRHSVCPNCGLSWPEGGYALGPMRGAGEASPPEPALPSGGIRRRILGAGLALFGTALILGGVATQEPAALAAGCVFGLAGTGTFVWGWRALQERRAAVRQLLERRVLQLATRKGGSLTVTEVASDLALSLTAAEGVLTAMDDGFRVRSDITAEGVLVYEFPEVQHRRLSG
jgi:predicted RNA-binding Zn-ribbon protein involved in translation (DUF1610 family)